MVYLQCLFISIFEIILFNIALTRLKKYFMFNPYIIKADKIKHIDNILTWTKWHHLYTGIIFYNVGLFSLCNTIFFNYLFMIIGLFLIIDDYYQHRMQKKLNNPDFHTIGHNIGKPLYHLRRCLIKKYKHLKWLNKI